MFVVTCDWYIKYIMSIIDLSKIDVALITNFQSIKM